MNETLKLTHVRWTKNLGRKEKGFTLTLWLVAIAVIVLVLAAFLTLTVQSMPSIKANGLAFIYGKTWNPVTENFGALPFLVGTLLTSFLALLMATPFSMAVALFLGEYYKKGIFAKVLKNMIDLLAAIPSVIYGFWGLFVLIPLVRKLQNVLDIPPYGVGIFSASVILSIMIMPYAISLSRQVIQMMPSDLKEAAYALGATRFEVIRKITIPYVLSGLFAGVLLALGRALGETMAVTMLIGNTNALPDSIFSPANTMASVIANEFTEATGVVYSASLVEIGLLLFIVVAIINLIGKKIIAHFAWS